ncbi:hypothetical protein AB4254_11070 [Vibrio breoganii]
MKTSPEPTSNINSINKLDADQLLDLLSLLVDVKNTVEAHRTFKTGHDDLVDKLTSKMGDYDVKLDTLPNHLLVAIKQKSIQIEVDGYTIPTKVSDNNTGYTDSDITLRYADKRLHTVTRIIFGLGDIEVSEDPSFTFYDANNEVIEICKDDWVQYEDIAKFCHAVHCIASDELCVRWDMKEYSEDANSTTARILNSLAQDIIDK